MDCIKATKKKRKLEGGSVHEIGEINDENSDEIFHNNNFLMELAMQIISNGKTVKTIQYKI